MSTQVNMKLCPNCQRPLAADAEEGSVCCASASRQWRCTQCAKVSEGFAFAYGRCPGCGGELVLPQASRIDHASALQAIRKAFEIELGGRAFYQRAAAESDDSALRDLFSRFALMEGEHMETLARRYHVDVPVPEPGFKAELAAIFGTVPNRPQDPESLFRIAIEMEQRAADFFAERSAQAGTGSSEQRLYRELAAEEIGHAQQLSAEYARWRVGKLGVSRADLLRPETPRTLTPVRLMNAAAVLLAHQDPQRTALRCGAQSTSYGALHEGVARAASVLRARGVALGERVAIRLPDGYDWVSAFLGTIWAGGVAVAVNPRIAQAEWSYILDEAGFHAILAESRDDTPAPWSERVVLLEDWRRAVARALPLGPEPMHPEAPAFWCHSSGTSGKPKAVVHAHRSARCVEQVSREALGVRADDRLFASSKLFFSYPLANSLFAGLKLGASVLLDPQWPTAQSVAATVQEQRATVLFSVPTLYRNLLREGLAPRIASAGVRLCVSAGEALPASLRDAWREQTGLTIIDGYGASETQVLVMLDRGDGQGFRPTPGVEIEPLAQADVNAPTRLRIRAPTLALGYLDRPLAQAETFRDGAFCPADLFSRMPRVGAVPPQVGLRTSAGDAQATPASAGEVGATPALSGGLGALSPGAGTPGGWRFAGREDSLVKIGGRWVNLIELEEQLASASAAIVEAAAVCVPDADGVDAVALFYVTGDATAAAGAGTALREFAQNLPHHQRPRWLHSIAALPRGPTGKLQRRKLQELHATLG
jgi:acyl-coenzyme A synthetase/AMP-(fatty) acid ligase/rubrerythrin